MVREVDPSNVQAALDQVEAGETIRLTAGRYRRPLYLSRKVGSFERPIRIQADPGAVICAETTAEDYRREGNERALALYEGRVGGYPIGQYPGLYPWLLEGRLVLTRCRHVVLESLELEEAWPTLIALEECADISIEGCDFRDATFAIGARGRATRGITIEYCTWVQDREPGRIWRDIDWRRIHGHPLEHGPIDLENDWRLFDGDFFRGIDVAGRITIRHCAIKAAFNAIHCFNNKHDPSLCRDVEVHDCSFEEIRDNILEPENTASNWWFHHNRIKNCHKWFSFQPRSSGFFYVFANTGWFDSIQGPKDDPHKGGGVFKLTKKPLPFKGPHWVFHNSFSVRSDYMRKGVLPRLRHSANAIRYVRDGEPLFDGIADFFGDLSADPKSHERRFQTDWQAHDVRFEHDCVLSPQWPSILQNAGYALGPGIAGDPSFAAPFEGDLRLTEDSPCIGRAPAFCIPLPDGTNWPSPGGDIGAWQGDRLFEGPSFSPLDDLLVG